jgi:hypothetical protein
VCQGGIGKLKEQSLLARYAFEILEQLTLDFALFRGGRIALIGMKFPGEMSAH